MSRWPASWSSETVWSTYGLDVRFDRVERLDVDTVAVLQIHQNVFDVGSVELDEQVVELVNAARPQLYLVFGVNGRLGRADLGLLFECVAYLFLPVDQRGRQNVQYGESTIQFEAAVASTLNAGRGSVTESCAPEKVHVVKDGRRGLEIRDLVV